MPGLSVLFTRCQQGPYPARGGCASAHSPGRYPGLPSDAAHYRTEWARRLSGVAKAKAGEFNLARTICGSRQAPARSTPALLCDLLVERTIS